jgi:hypothetical protein
MTSQRNNTKFLFLDLLGLLKRLFLEQLSHRLRPPLFLIICAYISNKARSINIFKQGQAALWKFCKQVREVVLNKLLLYEGHKIDIKAEDVGETHMRDGVPLLASW